MDSAKAKEKIKKLEEKKKTGKIVAFLKSKETDVVCAAIEAMGNIGDEDSVNKLTGYLDHENAEVRVAAGKALWKTGSEYAKTQVTYQLTKEKDPKVVEAIHSAM
jgi:HEAT repeat protein